MQPETRRTVAAAVGLDAAQLRARRVGGGDIAESYLLEDHSRSIFVKCLPPAQRAVLEAEQGGLARIAASDSVRVPSVHASGCGEVAWLALEFLDLKHPTDSAFAALGMQLAQMHTDRRENDRRFGLAHDNFIGATPQPNTHEGDWTEFFFAHRIGYQLDLLAERGERFGRDDTKRLRASWLRRFPDHAPEPSLIHGDLWGGNAAMLGDGTPVIFDPAVHYADRECDLAMARLFGGFGDAFFEAYERAWPLPDGWRQRLPYYQLYHLLNHANLFGGGYLARSRRLIDELANGSA
jgi:fructosamine-3-kinase